MKAALKSTLCLFVLLSAACSGSSSGGGGPAPIRVPTGPSVTLSYDQGGRPSDPFTVGTVTISAQFSEIPSTVPELSLDQAGSLDLPLTAMMATSDPLIWTFVYSVSPDDGGSFVDGPARVTIVADDQSNNAFGIFNNDSFVIDTLGPTVDLSFDQSGNSAGPFGPGLVRITATLNEEAANPPLLSLDQPGAVDVPPTPMSATGNPLAFTFDYTVNSADGSNFIDGLATLNIQAQDLAGNNQRAINNNSFVIDTAGAPVAFQVLSSNPMNGALLNPGLGRGSVAVTLSKEVDAETVSESTVQLSLAGQSVPGFLTLENAGRVLRISPSSDLLPNSNYQITISGLRSTANENLPSPFSSTFTTPAVMGVATLTVTPSMATTNAGVALSATVEARDIAGSLITLPAQVVLSLSGTTAPNNSVTAPSRFMASLNNGSATFNNLLFHRSGEQTLTATLRTQSSIQGLAKVQINANNASELVLISGQDQVAAPGAKVLNPMEARVLDRFGNGLPSGQGTFTVSAGSAQFENGHKIQRILTDGVGEGVNGLTTPVSRGFFPFLSIDPNNNRLLYPSNNRIRSIDTNTGDVATASRKSDGNILRIDGAVRVPTGELYASANSGVFKDNGGELANFAGAPFESGIFSSGVQSRFSVLNPTQMITDAQGKLYCICFASNGDPKLLVTVDPRRDEVKSLAGADNSVGSTGNGGPLAQATFIVLSGLAIDGELLYLVDNTELRAANLGSAPVTTMGVTIAPGFIEAVGQGNVGFGGIAVDPQSRDLFSADRFGNRVLRVNQSTGAITTFAGSLGNPGHADGAALSATFVEATGITVNNAGEVFIYDQDSSFSFIRKISGGQVSTLAGNGAGLRFFAEGRALRDIGFEAFSQFTDSIGRDRAGRLLIGLGDRIYRVAANDAVTTVVSGLSQIKAVTGDSNGVIYFTRGDFLGGIDVEVFNGSANSISILGTSIAAGQVATVSGLNPSGRITDLDMDSSGMLLIGGSTGVRLYNPTAASLSLGGVTVGADTLVSHPAAANDVQGVTGLSGRLFSVSSNTLQEHTAGGIVSIVDMANLATLGLGVDLSSDGQNLYLATSKDVFSIEIQQFTFQRLRNTLSFRSPLAEIVALPGGRIYSQVTGSVPAIEEFSGSQRASSATVEIDRSGRIVAPPLYLGPTPEQVTITVTAGTASLDFRVTGLVNPSPLDSDGDGLSDALEGQLGSQANNVDSDGDGLSDFEEFLRGTNINLADSDNDGLSDGDEVFIHSTDPILSDSDGDGTNDGAEITGGTDPKDDQSGALPGFDNVAPRFLGSNPVEGAEDVGIDQAVQAQLSESLDSATVNASSVLAFATDSSGQTNSVSLYKSQWRNPVCRSYKCLAKQLSNRDLLWRHKSITSGSRGKSPAH